MVWHEFAKLAPKGVVGSNPTASAFARRSELRRTKSAIVGREGGIRSPCTTSTFSNVPMVNHILAAQIISKIE